LKNFLMIQVIFSRNKPEIIAIKNKNIPIAFALNKQDKPDTIDTDDLKEIIGLTKLKKNKTTLIKYLSKAFKSHFRETSGYTGMGVGETFDWLTTNIFKM